MKTESEFTLLRTRERLRRVLELLHEELDEVEGQLAASKGNVRLDEKFFRTYLTDILFERPSGATSAELLRILRDELRLDVSPEGFRVFLSRYKKRGKLTYGRSSSDRWELASRASVDPNRVRR